MTGALEHILCVDDETDILEIVKMCLETVGEYKVTALNSGLKAVAQAKDIKPDIILLDFMMPEMDGRETLKALRNMPEFANTPIIFMTARVQVQEVEEYMELGATDVIPKPFDPMTLSEQISTIYEKFHAK